MRIDRWTAAAGAALLIGMSLSPSAAWAGGGTVNVPATADIFLASQPSGASVTGYFGTDYAPANSPVGIAVSGGLTLTFSAGGSTSVDTSCFAGPDGGCYGDESGFSPAPASNTYKGPADALIGVFEGPAGGSVQTGPASLDYTNAANTSLASQAPALNQIFFIGDGLTGTGSGAVQTFTAPAGAADLYLAAADSIGASTGDVGSLQVQVNGVPLETFTGPGGTAANPVDLSPSILYNDITGAVSASVPGQFYKFYWGGGVFQASGTVSDPNAADEYQLQVVGAGGGILDFTLLNSTDGFDGSFGHYLAAGVYAIGIQDTTGPDPNFKISLTTPVFGAPIAAPEPSAWALGLLGMAVVGGALRRRQGVRARA